MTPASSPLSSPAMLTQSQQPQLVLRDIHLPQPVSWWPLAPGWWLLLALAALLILASLFVLRRYKRRRYQRIALHHIAELEKNFTADHNRQLLLREISKLLRHMAVLHYPTYQCAGLCAESWLCFLDATLPVKEQHHHPFSSGVGRCLLSGPYESPTATVGAGGNNDDSFALIHLSRRWLKNLPLPPRSGRSV